MSYHEVTFDSNSVITLNDFSILNQHIFVCNYYPSNYDVLKLNINNVVLNPDSFITFKFIYNNQYPLTDVSHNYITQVMLNDVASTIKFNDMNNEINQSHYIIQEFILKRQKDDFIILSKVSKLENNNVGEVDAEIVNIKPTSNAAYSYYDISYGEYYVNTNTSQLDTQGDRNIMEVEFENSSDADIADFDKFIVNLYEEDGDLIDTSGNENETYIPDGLSSRNNTEFKFYNLSSDTNYEVKIHPLIPNNGNYNFNLKHLLRLKEINIITTEDTSSDSVKEQIESIQYKYLYNNEIYSSVNLVQGLRRLDSSTATRHEFQITTPNMYKCFKIVMSSGFTIMQNIILIGDV